jgi:hypothetical protein
MWPRLLPRRPLDTLADVVDHHDRNGVARAMRTLRS